MKLIPLTQGMFAQVDDSDYGFLMHWAWRAQKNGKTFYAVHEENGQTILMHKILWLGARLVDHRDLNGLNNQRANLRDATKSQNLANRGLDGNNTSGFKGVSWHRVNKKWRARLGINGARISLGMFSYAEDAARAYDKAARERFGVFARVNFPILEGA